MAGLSGMKEICEYYGRTADTVLKHIVNEAFPASKVSGSWMSDTELVDKWRRAKIVADTEKRVVK